MKFNAPLTEAVLLKHYERILVDVALNKKEIKTLYCPNNGALRSCDILGSRVWFSTSFNPRRKYPYVWELVEVDGGFLVCVNVMRSNDLVKEAIHTGIIPELTGYQQIEKDVMLDKSPVRIDLRLTRQVSDPLFSPEYCFVAVEPVTFGDEIHRGFVPDAPNRYAFRKLKDLIDLKRQGHRAVLCFCVQHTGIDRLFPADYIDKPYGLLLREAIRLGVEVVAYRVVISLLEMRLFIPIPVIVPQRMLLT